MMEKLLEKIVKYKQTFILINISLIVLSGIFLMYKYVTTGEIFFKDISLTGGTQISLVYKKGIPISVNLLEAKLSSYFKQKVSVRIVRDPVTNEPKYIVVEGRGLDLNSTVSFFEKNYKVKYRENEVQVLYFSPYFGKSVFSDFFKAIVVIVILISIIIYLRIRNVVSSLIVFLTLVFDLVLTSAFVSALRIPISTASIVAFLMMLGYGIDNNILVATNYIKEKKRDFVERMSDAVRTGLIMEFSTIIVLVLMSVFVGSEIIKNIASILLVALLVDAYFLVFGNIPLYKLLEEYGERKSG